MATEADYDAIIAPMLADVAKRCEELGMSLIARVEWTPGEAGLTIIRDTANSGVAQRLTEIAAFSRGNIDALCIDAARQFDVSQSIVLRMMRPSASGAI